MNRAIEEKTSLKSFKWRREAKKAGIPYGQYLLQRNLEYRVDHAYLIQPQTGLLISDAHRPEAIRRDDEAVSAMLTAIQDFVKESFTTESQSTLETADIGEYSLWVMQGPEAMLACVIFGMPPRTLREDFTEVLESIHLQYGQQLEHFEGQQIQIIEPLLEDCLFSQAKNVAAIWFGYQRFLFNQSANTLIKDIEGQAGIVLTKTELNGGELKLEGLRDHAAQAPETLLAKTDLDPEKVKFKFAPFHSLESDIIKQRIDSKITIPDGVMQFGDVYYDDEALLNAVVKQLQAPESVNLKVNKQVLEVSGVAPIAFHKQLEIIGSKIEGLEAKVNLDDLAVLEVEQVAALLETVDDAVFNLRH